jgi:hypothetical protein
MQAIIDILHNLGPWCAALIGLCSALIVVFSLVPGDQPEATLQKVVDFLSKFSVK